MSQGAKDLDHLMLDGLQDGGYMVSGGRELFMEVIDTTTGRVWMSAAPVKMADFEALALEASLVKVGIARASMDRAAFQHSPGSPGKPYCNGLSMGVCISMLPSLESRFRALCPTAQWKFRSTRPT